MVFMKKFCIDIGTHKHDSSFEKVKSIQQRPEWAFKQANPTRKGWGEDNDNGKIDDSEVMVSQNLLCF